MGLSESLLEKTPGDRHEVRGVLNQRPTSVDAVLKGHGVVKVGYEGDEVVEYHEYWDFSNGTGLWVTQAGLIVPNIIRIPFGVGFDLVQKTQAHPDAPVIYDYTGPQLLLQNSDKLPVHHIIGHRDDICEQALFWGARSQEVFVEWARKMLEPQALAEFESTYRPRMRIDGRLFQLWTPERVGADIRKAAIQAEGRNQRIKAEDQMRRYNTMREDLGRTLDRYRDYLQRISEAKAPAPVIPDHDELAAFRAWKASRTAPPVVEDIPPPPAGADPLASVVALKGAIKGLDEETIRALLARERDSATPRQTILDMLTGRLSSLTARTTSPLSESDRAANDRQAIAQSDDELNKLKG